jgi:ubiquinone/menaquinone biosynthesis C-methylase UbiE
MAEPSRVEVLMPGGIELTRIAERHMNLGASSEVLSVACGTGELELYLAAEYGCRLIGIDTSKSFIERARGKATARDLQRLAKFEVGDGNAIAHPSCAFDLVFCSGALCAFFYNGLMEFHRVLRPGGRAVIIDVVWRTTDVPSDVEDTWSGGTAHILTVERNIQAFQDAGFRTVFSEEYHQPEWWGAYYDDRGDDPHWQEERRNYQAHQEYLGLGLFVIEKVDGD